MSHVALEQNQCPVCGELHAVGVLPDRRLNKNAFGDEQVVTGYSLCQKCKQQSITHFPFIVATHNGDTVKDIAAPNRTGEVLWMDRENAASLMQVPVDKLDEAQLAFIDPEAADLLKQKVAEFLATQNEQP